jgi:hypothetical protein
VESAFMAHPFPLVEVRPRSSNRWPVSQKLGG